MRQERVVCDIGTIVTLTTAALSHGMQVYDGLREFIFFHLGEEWVSIIQNHGGSLALIPGVIFVLGSVVTRLSGEWSDHKDTGFALMASISGGIAALSVAALEISRMQPTFDASKCGDAYEFCRGDWGDVVALAPPFVAGLFIICSAMSKRLSSN